MKIFQIIFLIIGLTVCASAQKSVLSGTVYDANGSVVTNAKVSAFNQKGEKFETRTNDEGVYTLNLPFNQYLNSTDFREAKYNILVEANGFKNSITKDFVFIPSQFGKMRLDIGLEIKTFVNIIT